MKLMALAGSDSIGSGQITEHKDYWDASFPLYGTFPIIGLIMKLIKKFVTVKPPSLKLNN